MNPTSKETPNLNLPPPVGEGQAAPAKASEKTPQTPERGAPAAPEAAPGVAAAQPAAAAPTIPVPLPPAGTPAATQTDDSSTTKTVKTKVLDDPDLIEKEWVSKAKHIVEQTRDDPHRQSEELTVVKADYMKKRYDKTIKLSK